MKTKFGPTLEPDDFEEPFDEIIANVIDKGRRLYGLLSDHARPQRTQRPLEILIIDDPSLNAKATTNGACDRIIIFHGAFEHVYGNLLGLFSVPTFLPEIGDISLEVKPDGLSEGFFPPVPILKNRGTIDYSADLYIPNDQRRISAGNLLAEVTLEFLVFHEIGHILGGHLEILANAQPIPLISEAEFTVNTPEDNIFRQVLECDADAFACHVTSWIHYRAEMESPTHHLFNSSKWGSQEFALVTYLISICTLFRALYRVAPVNADKSFHPHPAVRACLIASSTIARGLRDGSFAETAVEEILRDSVGNIEAVWADLALAGQNPTESADWGTRVNTAAMGLFEQYGSRREILDRHARIPRRWDDWVSPDSEDSDAM